MLPGGSRLSCKPHAGKRDVSQQSAAGIARSLGFSICSHSSRTCKGWAEVFHYPAPGTHQSGVQPFKLRAGVLSHQTPATTYLRLGKSVLISDVASTSTVGGTVSIC